MSKKDAEDRKYRLVAMILSHVKEDGTVDLAWNDQNDLSPATFYRAMKDLEEEAYVGRLRPGVYKSAIPPARLASDPDLPPLVNMAKSFYEFMDSVSRAANAFSDSFFAHFLEIVENKRNRCMACENYQDCFEGRIRECPHAKIPEVTEEQIAAYMQKFTDTVFARENLSRENRLSDLPPSQDQDPEEEGCFSREKEDSDQSSSSPEKDPGEGTGPSPSPACNQLQTVDRPDPRSLLKQRLAESKAAERAKPPTMRQQLKEVKAVWDACLRERYGDGYSVGRWGGKEHKLVPDLIKDHGLELTKSGIQLYFRHWNDLLRENAWITDDTPTIGMLWHFRESVFRAAQGKGRIGERVSKRTADEWVDDGDAEEQGKWPAREEEATPSA